MKKVIATKEAPAAIGSYSQAIKANGLVFVSGQIPINPATDKIEGKDIKEQAKQALNNVKAILAAAGVTMEDVVKTTAFISNMNDFGDFNEIYGQFFGNDAPARSAVTVKSLPKGALVEIEVIAVEK